MISEAYIEETVAALFDNIRFKQEPQGLYSPLEYMIGIGGKRIRPKLCLTAYSLFKDSFDEGILEPAAALEVFHTFTLIHDDIMDKSPLRRGMPTVWKKWNEDTAILSGDVMLIDSYERIAKAPRNVIGRAMALFSETAAGVCEGQQLDMDFESVPKVSMTQYKEMIGLKTAVLLACSAEMGAIIGGAQDAECKALYNYGYELGMAFQVADDYLDAFGDEKVFGKPIGGDIINNKKSWLLTHLQDISHDSRAVTEALEMPVDTPEQREAKIARVKGMYVDAAVDVDAKAEILRYSKRAMTSVEDIGLSRVRMEMLCRFADRLVGRVK